MRAPMKRDAATAFDELMDALSPSEDSDLPCGTDGSVAAFYHQHGVAIVAREHASPDARKLRTFSVDGSARIREHWSADGGEETDLVHVLGLCVALEFSSVAIHRHPFDAGLVAKVLACLTRAGFWSARTETFENNGGHALRVHAGEIVVVIPGLKPGAATIAEIPLRPTTEAA